MLWSCSANSIRIRSCSVRCGCPYVDAAQLRTRSRMVTRRSRRRSRTAAARRAPPPRSGRYARARGCYGTDACVRPGRDYPGLTDGLCSDRRCGRRWSCWMKVLIIDDEPDLLEAAAAAVRFFWHEAAVLTASGGRSGLRLMHEQPPDVVVLDLAMPDMDGFAVLRDFRRFSDAPVLVLGARESEADQVRALEAGADDYVLKPVGHLALLARIKALLRRSLATPERALPPLQAGRLQVDFAAQQARVGGQPVQLGDREYALLYHLARNAGRVLSPEALASLVWGQNWGAGSADVKALVHRLRAKLLGPGGADPDLIENTRGRGYRFVVPTTTTPAVEPESVLPREPVAAALTSLAPGRSN